MKPYLLFAGETYECNGGMNDYQGDFNTIEEAISHFNEHNVGAVQGHWYKWDWYDVREHATMKRVSYNGDPIPFPHFTLD